MTYPELSRRVANVLRAPVISEARPEVRRRVVAEAEQSDSFEDLSPEVQAIIIQGEAEIAAMVPPEIESSPTSVPAAPLGPPANSAKKTPIVSGTLCNGDINGTNVHQLVSYSPDRGIEISGSDFGRAPQGAFGSSEYEYWRTVKPKHVGRVFYELLKQADLPHEKISGERLIELICTRFGGDHHAEKRFRIWCDDYGIPTEFFSWVSGD